MAGRLLRKWHSESDLTFRRVATTPHPLEGKFRLLIAEKFILAKRVTQLEKDKAYALDCFQTACAIFGPSASAQTKL